MILGQGRLTPLAVSILMGGSNPAAVLDPVSVFGSRLLYWNDPSDLANTWQNSSRTTAAVVGSPVGSRFNKGTLGGYAAQGTAGSRPILRQSGSIFYDESDTIDDFLSIALNLSAYSAITVAVGVAKESDGSTGMAMEFSDDVNANNGAFSVAASVGGTSQMVFGLRGTTNTAYLPSGYASPQSRVIVDLLDIGGAGAATEIFPYVDGTLAQSGVSGTTAGTGNFGNYTLYEMMRAGATLPLYGSLYQRLIIAGVITAPERAWLQTWMGAKQGKTL